MITNYFRPATLQEALSLLAQPNTLPLGGGTKINSPAYQKQDLAVVDLQNLGLNGIRQSGYTLEVGATATLQQVWENPSTPAALRQTLEKETSLNLRNASTLAGSLVSAEGRSPLATMLLALDARLSLESASGALQMGLVEYWALRPAGIITLVSLPLNAQAAYEQVSRTPADFPLVAAALAQWGSGRTRLALGGWGSLPTLVMDGTEPEGLQETARAACSEAQDQWASAAYRMDVAATLAGRCLANLQGGKTE